MEGEWKTNQTWNLKWSETHVDLIWAGADATQKEKEGERDTRPARKRSADTVTPGPGETLPSSRVTQNRPSMPLRISTSKHPCRLYLFAAILLQRKAPLNLMSPVSKQLRCRIRPPGMNTCPRIMRSWPIDLCGMSHVLVRSITPSMASGDKSIHGFHSAHSRRLLKLSPSHPRGLTRLEVASRRRIRQVYSYVVLRLLACFSSTEE